MGVSFIVKEWFIECDRMIIEGDDIVERRVRF